MSRVESWDRVLLDKAHPCKGKSAWRAGPEGGCSQMFLCDDCGMEFVVHPGQVQQMKKWKHWKAKKKTR